MAKDLLKHIPNFSSTNFWISPKGAIGALVIGLTVAGGLITLGCIPSVPLWNIITIISLLALSVLTWLFITQIYLRTGQSMKIGLAYDGYEVKREEWTRIRNMLRDLFKNGEIKHQVSLRFVPVRTANIDRYVNKYMERYGFTILVAIQQSRHIKENTSKHDQNPFFSKTSFKFTEEVEKDFVATTLKQAVELVTQKARTIETLHDVLKARAHNLYDMMLRITAALCYREGKYEDCAVISRHLDQSLSSIMGPSQEPRRQVRWLDMNSRLRPAGFSVRDIPGPDKLKGILAFAETALCYFDDFPPVATAISRTRFLVDDEQGAIELTKRYEERIEEIKKAGLEPTEEVLLTYSLNSGFLEFINGHWVKAYNAYREMLTFDLYHNENWPELVSFIDYVANLECYDGVCYLQMLYRLIAKQPVPVELQAAAQDWVNQDDSRKELRTLLARGYPPLFKETNETIAQSKKQDEKVKKRSKQKRKKRKKR